MSLLLDPNHAPNGQDRLPERIGFFSSEPVSFIGLQRSDFQCLHVRFMNGLRVLSSHSSDAFYGVVMHVTGSGDAGG
jgi:hypothetical protein